MDKEGISYVSLNPFEVREVLQVAKRVDAINKAVSIPLKSGRCCKDTKVQIAPCRCVSIPLKSGRCCKAQGFELTVVTQSQSL